jgi:hypothetical protein
MILRKVSFDQQTILLILRWKTESVYTRHEIPLGIGLSPEPSACWTCSSVSSIQDNLLQKYVQVFRDNVS